MWDFNLQFEVLNFNDVEINEDLTHSLMEIINGNRCLCTYGLEKIGLSFQKGAIFYFPKTQRLNL